MRNIFSGSKNGLISHFCCLFSYYSLTNLIINAILFIIGMSEIHKFNSSGHCFVKPESLENYNNSIFEALTLAAVVSIVVFLVNEIKETNNKNAYALNFCSTIFKAKFQLDSIIKNILFGLIPILTIVTFVLLKYGEHLSDYWAINRMCYAVCIFSVIILFSIVEIIIFYFKINHKKIEINKSLHGLIPSKFTVNFIENSQQANEIIDIINFADSITSVKNSIYILFDIFSEYNYFNKLEIYESISDRICNDIIEFCADKKYGNANLEITFVINSIISDIINDVTKKDNKSNRILLAFFLLSKYFCNVEFDNMNTLSKNSQDEFFKLLPYIYLLYSDKLKNKSIIIEKYRELFIEKKMALIDDEERNKLYRLFINVFEYKFAINEIKMDNYFLFKKLKYKDIYSLFIHEYMIFNNQI